MHQRLQTSIAGRPSLPLRHQRSSECREQHSPPATTGSSSADEAVARPPMAPATRLAACCWRLLRIKCGAAIVETGGVSPGFRRAFNSGTADRGGAPANVAPVLVAIGALRILPCHARRGAPQPRWLSGPAAADVASCKGAPSLRKSQLAGTPISKVGPGVAPSSCTDAQRCSAAASRRRPAPRHDAALPPPCRPSLCWSPAAMCRRSRAGAAWPSSSSSCWRARAAWLGTA